MEELVPEANKTLRTWSMSWIVPTVISSILMSAGFMLGSNSKVAALAFGGLGIITLICTPLIIRTSRIEMRVDQIIVYDLFGKVAKVLNKSNINSVDIQRGNDAISWIYTSEGKYMIPRLYNGNYEVLGILAGWVRDNADETTT